MDTKETDDRFRGVKFNKDLYIRVLHARKLKGIDNGKYSFKTGKFIEKPSKEDEHHNNQ